MSEGGRSSGGGESGKNCYADYAPTPTRGYRSDPTIPRTGGDMRGEKVEYKMGYFEQMEYDVNHACFVASCVYGSINHPKVEKLRRFRDEVLSKWWLGRKFIASYYSGSGLRLALFIQKKTPRLIPCLKKVFDWVIPHLPQEKSFRKITIPDSMPIEIFDLPWEKVVSQMKNFLEEEVKKRDSEELLVPLSGGVDSCTAAALCRLTNLRVTAITAAAEGYIRKEDVKDAENFCAHFGISHEIIDLSSVFKGISSFDFPQTDHLMMAFRNSVIKEYAEARGAVLIGGANKTERYSGLYCRNSIIGDIFPLELFKTQVYQLAAFLGVPGYILEKPSHSGMMGTEEDNFWGLGYRYFDWLSFLIERGDNFNSIIKTTHASIEILEAIQKQMKHAKVFFSFPDFKYQT
jgi:NAD+ synthase